MTRAASAPGPSFQELFTPKLVTALKEGYGLGRLKADAVAGLTVAIVALPLSMAIAIASGASPAQGLYTAIVGGFFVSLLGGSRFQIGGPAGAFIVLVATTVQTHGMDGLLIATILSGLMLVAIGFLRLGTYIKFVPYPVTVGFTAGIAVIIFSSQIKDLLGLTLASPEPGPLLEKLPVLWESLPSLDPATVFLALATIIGISVLKRVRPHWPGLLLAVAGAAAVTALLNLDVATIGSRFGGIPSHPPIPALPAVTMGKVIAVLPSAFAFTLLGSIESLLSAVVADGMTGRRHRSNCELVAQGVANVASGIFGGVCVTGTIARTATNVRAGAATPIAGMLHSGFLLTFILVAAPLASYIPLASLAGVLAIVAWNMIEKEAVRTLVTASRGDAAVLLTTFLLTIFRDLTEAIVVGFALGSVLFIHRMSKTTAIETDTPFVAEDEADPVGGRSGAAPSDPEVVVFRISGAFFFGAAASIGSVLDRIADTHRVLIVDFAAVPFLDSTAAETIRGMAEKAERRHVRVILTGTHHSLRRVLFAHAVKPPLVSYERTISEALERTHPVPAEA
ncbi:sodium-independent anion transporter [Rhodobium orientis]|uniref:Sodium-independent anion transporter n=1 Tax=Rhodobium orientis TaxID=34017 RepID=A0A327JFH7_9HYPH|nr:SulP family inorganic anion transporter [Rhodobium orientis]MBK5948285.1 sodium-independent anion transporter [Rhodobium orientis]RAI25150.1 sodium-independent anion transporter [Rhodobium orientis]